MSNKPPRGRPRKDAPPRPKKPRAAPRPKRSEAEVIAKLEAEESEAAAHRTEQAEQGRQAAQAYAAKRGEQAQQLTRAEAVAAARDTAEPPLSRSRPYQQAFADRLIELGHAYPSSDGRRSGPSGPSGKHVNPELRVTVPQVDQERYKDHAGRRRLTLSEWVREALEEKAEREDEAPPITLPPASESVRVVR